MMGRRDEEDAGLDGRLSTFIDQLLSLAPASPEVDRLIERVAAIGEAEVKQSSLPPTRTFGSLSAASGRQTVIRQELDGLLKLLMALDPARADSPKRWFSRSARRRLSLKDYFDSFSLLDARAASILTGLISARDSVQRDLDAMDAALREQLSVLAALEAAERQAAYYQERLVVAQRLRAHEVNAAVLERGRSAVEERRHTLLAHSAVVRHAVLSLKALRRGHAEVVEAIEKAVNATRLLFEVALAAAQATALRHVDRGHASFTILEGPARIWEATGHELPGYTDSDALTDVRRSFAAAWREVASAVATSTGSAPGNPPA